MCFDDSIRQIKHLTESSKGVLPPIPSTSIAESVISIGNDRDEAEPADPFPSRNTIATAGVLGGVTGLLLGGFWIGAAGFVATSYLAKKDRPRVVSSVLFFCTCGCFFF